MVYSDTLRIFFHLSNYDRRNGNGRCSSPDRISGFADPSKKSRSSIHRLLCSDNAYHVLEFRSPTALFQIPPEVITSNQPFWNGLVNACSSNHIPFSEYQAQFDTLNASRHSYTGWLYYPGFIAQTLMQNLLFIVLVAFVLFPKSEILKRAPLVPGAIFLFSAMRSCWVQCGACFEFLTALT
jgi:hypothetical protein